MQEKGFDRSRLEFFPIGSRQNKLEGAEVMLGLDSPAPDPGAAAGVIERTARDGQAGLAAAHCHQRSGFDT